MRPFTEVLREIRRGQAVDQASRQLAEVVRQAAFTLIATDIAERTGCPLVYGTVVDPADAPDYDEEDDD